MGTHTGLREFHSLLEAVTAPVTEASEWAS